MARTTTRRTQSTKAKKAKTEAETVQATTPAVTATPEAMKRPGGKLGLVVERLKAEEGATLIDLVELTGWQKHTVRGALSGLRHRGFAIRLENRDGLKAYRLAPEAG